MRESQEGGNEEDGGVLCAVHGEPGPADLDEKVQRKQRKLGQIRYALEVDSATRSCCHLSMRNPIAPFAQSWLSLSQSQCCGSVSRLGDCVCTNLHPFVRLRHMFQTTARFQHRKTTRLLSPHKIANKPRFVTGSEAWFARLKMACVAFRAPGSEIPTDREGEGAGISGVWPTTTSCASCFGTKSAYECFSFCFLPRYPSCSVDTILLCRLFKRFAVLYTQH
jgi:hypothetical protein